MELNPAKIDPKTTGDAVTTDIKSSARSIDYDVRTPHPSRPAGSVAWAQGKTH